MATKEKSKKRKAERLRRKAWKPDEPRYTVINTVAPAVVKADPITVGGVVIETERSPEEVAAEVVAAMTAAEEPITVEALPIQPRWEVQYRDGEYQVIDHMTGFVATVGSRGHHGTEAGSYASELNSAQLAIDALVWSEPVTKATVLYTTEREHDRFFLLESSVTLGEWAMYDTITSLVHPLDNTGDLDELVKEVDFFNSHPKASLQDCVEEALYSKERHWFPREDWVVPPPEDVDPDPQPAGDDRRRDDPVQWDDESDEDFRTRMIEEGYDPKTIPAPAAAATETPVPDEVKVLVVSSANWQWGGVVGEVLQRYWNRIGNPNMVLYTSGSNRGAEQAAVKLASAVEGLRHEVLPDSLIGNADLDYAFGFITDFSKGASAIVDYLEVIHVPVHVIREESATIDDPWSDR